MFDGGPGEAPYRIEPGFLAAVDRVVDHALALGLTVVVTQHHDHALTADPSAANRSRLLASTARLASHFADHPDGLCLEPLNEPRDALTPVLWDDLLRQLVETVRGVSPERTLVVGPGRMNDLDALPELEPPADDHLVATVHYYAPFPFTHQGCGWVSQDADDWLGTTWHDEQRPVVRRDLAAAERWARERGLPMLVGELGTVDRADRASRVRWTRAVREEAERLGLPWCAWDLATDFGVYDPDAGAWRTDLRDALLGQAPLA